MKTVLLFNLLIAWAIVGLLWTIYYLPSSFGFPVTVLPQLLSANLWTTFFIGMTIAWVLYRRDTISKEKPE